MIHIKTADDLVLMRRSGRVVGELLAEFEKLIKPGVSTRALDKAAREFIEARGAKPAFLGYHGYPATICASVNAQVVHGIPNDTPLQEGDIVGVDVGAELGGFVGDAARSFRVGKVSAQAERLLQVTSEALNLGLAQARDGGHLQDIGAAIQAHVEAAGFSVVRDFVGHGIGRKMHEEPQIPNYGRRGLGPKIRKGMTFAIEPMVNVGAWQVDVQADGWTVLTRDGSLSAHFEDTIAVTDGEPEILTRIT